jgi:hypothetical protein
VNDRDRGDHTRADGNAGDTWDAGETWDAGRGADDIPWYEERGPDEPAFPWPPSEGESVIGAFADTWKGAALTPTRFFSAMPEHGTLGSALLYYLPLGIAVAGASLFWTVTLTGTGPEREAVLGEMPLGGAMNPLLEFALSPVILLLSLFIAAGVTHGMLKLFGGANRSFSFTTRVFAFAYSPQIFALVPFVGTVVGFVWMVGVAVLGLRAGHRTSLGRVLAAVLIPVTVALIFMAIAAFIATTGRLLSH